MDDAAAEFNIVVSGHSHKPRHTARAGAMYLNPGSAGRRRIQLPITVARLNLRWSPWSVIDPAFIGSDPPKAHPAHFHYHRSLGASVYIGKSCSIEPS
jgi:hypothetical protein